MRFVVGAAVLLLASSAHAAETYTCVDADNEVTVIFDYDRRAEQPFLRIDMQLTHDYGFSTDPHHPNHDGEFVAEHFAGDGFIGADVLWRDEAGRVSPVLALGLRIVEVHERPRSLVTGGVSVSAGGVWTVVCDVQPTTE
jgi:hypothetical protein